MLCPICNGLEAMTSTCLQCSGITEDYGKFTDYVGPYAPYRSIQDMKLTDGFQDALSHQCIHVMYCPACSETSTVSVAETIL